MNRDLDIEKVPKEHWPPELKHGRWKNTDRLSYSTAAETTLTSDVRLIIFIPVFSELVKFILHHWS